MLVFLFWIFIMPIRVSMDQIMTKENMNWLLWFDCIFVLDRFLDLFVTFY
jgi:hypothetical protein